MTRNAKVSAAVVALFLVVVGAVFALNRDDASTAAGGGAPAVLRAESHRLDVATEGEVTLVEFLDFECEACRAAYPVVEDIRERFDGRITYAIRYFPLPSHFNAENAAFAVEAAAQQGRLEDMYTTMFDTQPQWGNRQVSQAPLFRQFAVDLGLDMAAYDTAVASPETFLRVMADRNDGVALGVQGTPTFFLDGEQITVNSADSLAAAVEEAVAG